MANKYNRMPAATLGITIAAGMAVFVFVGNWLGEKFGNQQVWILVGMFFGLFYGGYEIWKFIRQNNLDSS